MTLKIAAAFHHQQQLTEPASNLRAELQALTGQSFRRINRFIELGLYGALQCARRAGGIAGDAAIYVSSEAPMLADCVKALKGVVAEGRPPTPFEFMNISGNMAGFYIAQHLQLNGPQLVVHRHGAGLEAAAELLSLRSALHRRSLLGYVEEGVWPLAQQCERLGLSPETPMLECSHWLYLDDDCVAPLAWLEPTQRFHDRVAVAAAVAQLPRGWRLRLGSGCASDDITALRRVRAELETLPVDAGWSSGHVAAAVSAFVMQPDAAGLAHLNRSGDGGYYLLRVRAAE